MTVKMVMRVEEILKKNFRDEVLIDLLDLKGGVFDFSMNEILPLGTAFIIRFLQNPKFLIKYQSDAYKGYYETAKNALAAGISFGYEFRKNSEFYKDCELIRRIKDDVINNALKILDLESPKDFVFNSMAEDVFLVFINDLYKPKSDALSQSNYVLAGFEAVFLFGVTIGYEKH